MIRRAFRGKILPPEMPATFIPINLFSRTHLTIKRGIVLAHEIRFKKNTHVSQQM